MVASAGDKPRFRQDLVAEPIEDGAARFIDVADPDTGSLFRFYEVEYSLACAMDGERDVAGIVQWAKEELGLTPSPKEVQHVIMTLRDLGYLESGAAAAAAATPAATPKEAPKPAVQPAGVKAPAGKPSVNKWDQPTAMGDPDEYLEPGVVVPRSASRSPGADDLELGSAGAHAPKVETDLPRAADLELGAPGAATAPASRPPMPKTGGVELGKPGASAARSEVSIDLADHMAVGADDVKEAVRQSQVMKAVDVPKELVEAAEAVTTAPAKPAEGKGEAKKAQTPAEKRAEAKAERKAEADRKLEADRKAEAERRAEADKKVEAKAEAKEAKAEKKEAKAEAKAEKKEAKAEAKEAKAEAKTEAKTDKKVEAKGKPAVEAPKRAEEKRPVAPPAPKSGTSPMLVALLVIVVLAAGAFLAYRYVFKKPATQTPAPAAAVQPTQPEVPAAPPVETEKLATEQQDPVDLKATSAGQVETIVVNDTAVKTGDVVAQLAGHKGIDAEIAAMQKDIDTRVKPELDKAEKDRDAAQTAGNKAAVTAAEARITDRKKSLDEKQAKLDAKKADLAKLQIKAPDDGKVTAVAKANGKVAAGDVVAKLTRSPVLAATFKTASGVAPGAHVVLATKPGEQKLSCTVATADASGVKVACPADTATEGTEVTFVGVDPNAPAAGSAATAGSGEIEMNDEGGSAAGAAAPAAGSTGAGTPAAGAPAVSPAHVAPKAPARPAHVTPKAPAHPAAEKPADKPADQPAPPADKPAEAPAPTPAPAAPSTGDTLK